MDHTSDEAAAPRTLRTTRRPTIYDIAERVGLNPSTVSRALNKPGRINPETAARVQAVAAELGFRVNPAARALPTGTTGTYALVLPDITNPVHFDLIRGVEQISRAHGRTLAISESQSLAEQEREAITSLQPAVDGILVVASRLASDDLTALASLTPIVAVNSVAPELPSVVASIEPAMSETMSHLQALGHRSIAYLGVQAFDINRRKWELLLAVATKLGLSIVEIATEAPTVAGGADVLPRILASSATAVIAYNDLVAHGVLQAAHAQGLQIPDRFSLVGFDDIFSAALSTPALTTVKTPLRELGSLAMTILLDPERNRTPSLQRLPVELIIRDSTGAPPAR